MIKMKCDKCGKYMGCIIDTSLYLCYDCIKFKEEDEILDLIAEVKKKQGYIKVPDIFIDEDEDEEDTLIDKKV